MKKLLPAALAVAAGYVAAEHIHPFPSSGALVACSNGVMAAPAPVWQRAVVATAVGVGVWWVVAKAFK